MVGSFTRLVCMVLAVLGRAIWFGVVLVGPESWTTRGGGEREGARYHLVSEFAPTHPRPAKANYKRSPAGCANGGRWARSSPTRFMLAKRGSHHAFWN